MLDLDAGAILGPYRIEEIAGRGGSGIVFRATHTPSGETVAIKANRDHTDTTATARLEREASLLELIDHPGVLGFRELIEVDGNPYLVTNWVAGSSLAETMLAGPMPVSRALLVCQQLAGALDHLHANGIVHRDLSPSNVMVDTRNGNDTVTLIDLGVGRGDDTATVTVDGASVGTPRYMAPEVIRADDVDGRADQYSLAVILHELLVGASPVPGSNDIASALHHQLNTAPTPLTEVDPYLPATVESAVLKALAKNPQDRFTTATEFLDTAAHSDSDGFNPLAAASRHSDERSIAMPLAVAAVAVCLVGALLAWWLLRDGSGTETAAPDATTTWTDGLASSISCNLVTEPDFASGTLPTDYFGEPAGTERIVDHGGVDDSAVLEVGRANQFGQYAEILAIVPGRQYVFMAHVGRSGEVADATIDISWLDADFQPYDEATTVSVRPNGFGLHTVTATAPDGAAYGLPALFKDASPGVLLADELIFGPASCAELPVIEGA